MILHELEGDFPYYQSVTKKMYYEMVKDMGLGSFFVYLYNSTWLRKTITQRILKKKQTHHLSSTYYMPVIVLYM